MHDVDDYKLVGKDGILFNNAKKFLNKNNVNKNKINLICNEISKISFKGSGETHPETLEGKIAQDADRIDALGAMSIARTFTYGVSHNLPIYSPDIPFRNNMSEQEYHSNNTTSINHFYEKVLKLPDLMNTEEAKSIAKHRHNFLLSFLQEFFDEWEGIK